MQNITLYSYLSRKKEPFKPLKKNRIGLYTCGPTVYNFVHIGNLRTYVFEDLLRRTLAYAGANVTHVMNLTDVDDKIIRDSQAAGLTISQFVKPYEKAFREDIKKLNIQKAHHYPKATKHIPEMIALTERLLKKGIAYEMDGSIYFAVKKFNGYGKLSHIKKRELKAGARIDADEYTKENVQDFALWKAAKVGEPSWKSPFGDGRPGWHIECSAMSIKYLGKTFDIHAGGIDLLFPHHENEIAQSEGVTGKPFVKYFIEGEHLLVNGEKMSKSLGNVYTLRDLEAKNINILAFRYLVLTSQYRSKLNFTWESLAAAESSLNRLYEFVLVLKSPPTPLLKKGENAADGSLLLKRRVREDLKNHRGEFNKALFNDLDTPKALATVWKLIHEYNKQPEQFNAKEILNLFYDFDQVLGLGLKNIKPKKIPQEIKKLANTREEFRKNKQWADAYMIRDELAVKGWVVVDTQDGYKIDKAHT